MANILILDDTALIRRRIKNVLLYDNHEIFELENSGALKSDSFSDVYSLKDIDVVFLDIYLKEENGFNILRYLTKKHPRIDVIVVSGDSKMTTVTKAVEYGAKDFLAKPFDNQLLLNKLQKIISKKNVSGKTNSVLDLNNELGSFNTQLTLELNRSLRSKISVSFLKFNFESINDSEMIMHINNQITANIRDIDQIYFVGHKNICFILPLTDKEGRKVFHKRIENIIFKDNSEDLKRDAEKFAIIGSTFPEDIMEDDSSDLNFSELSNYRKMILNKLNINNI